MTKEQILQVIAESARDMNIARNEKMTIEVIKYRKENLRKWTKIAEQRADISEDELCEALDLGELWAKQYQTAWLECLGYDGLVKAIKEQEKKMQDIVLNMNSCHSKKAENAWVEGNKKMYQMVDFFNKNTGSHAEIKVSDKYEVIGIEL